jgi:hypothetical protein
MFGPQFYTVLLDDLIHLLRLDRFRIRAVTLNLIPGPFQLASCRSEYQTADFTSSSELKCRLLKPLTSLNNGLLISLSRSPSVANLHDDRRPKARRNMMGWVEP